MGQVGSITERGGKYRVQVRRKGHKPQCRTFDTKAKAVAWERQTETDLDSGATRPQLGAVTVGDVIKAYRKLRENARPISDSSNEHYMLKSLERGFAQQALQTISPDDLVAYAEMRRDEGAGPYTINMDISKLGTVLRYGGAALRIAPPDVVGAARPLLNHLRLIGGGGKRERRPTDDELRRILDHLGTVYGPIYAQAVAFAAITAMRRGEVCSITRMDIEPDVRIVRVMRKHPRKGKTMERVPLLGQAWDIAQAQPEYPDGRLFPIDPATLSKYFCWTCRALGIPDLKLHDMRHEGTSRLFEAGYSIEKVALVTGHKSWVHLKRYTNLRPEDLTRQDAEPRQKTPPRRGSRPSASRPPGTSSSDKSQR